MPNRGSTSVKEFIMNNILWLITTFLAIGGFIVTIDYQGKAIIDNTNDIRADKDRIVIAEKSFEKNMVKLDAVQTDIADIKIDIRDIKKVILKPAFNIAKTDG